MSKLTPFLMFTGGAEEAINLYRAAFKDTVVISLKKFEKSEHMNIEGKVEKAIVKIYGQELIFYDSPPIHEFQFTPSLSLFIKFESEKELDTAYEALSKDGKVMMPPGEYPFSKKYAWLSDKFGVSWQLSL